MPLLEFSTNVAPAGASAYFRLPDDYGLRSPVLLAQINNNDIQ